MKALFIVILILCAAFLTWGAVLSTQSAWSYTTMSRCVIVLMWMLVIFSWLAIAHILRPVDDSK